MNTTIAKRLKGLRKQKGLSQEEVADYLHISQPTYARIEKGESYSWAGYLQPICKLYDIQPEELFSNDSVIINNNNQSVGGGYIQINQISEKLIEQYEARLKEKDVYIQRLEQLLDKK